MTERPPRGAERIEVTRGFVAFVVAMLLPAAFALAGFLGACAVSSEVYAAEASAAATTAGTPRRDAVAPQVAGWKRGLVGFCPIH